MENVDTTRTFRVVLGKNDLLSQNPKLAIEFHPTKNSPFTPETVTKSSRHKMWWLGQCGHEWEATINRRSQGQGCLACSDKNKVIIVGFNDFESQNPELMKEWDWSNNVIKPSEISYTSSARINWLGCCGHKWDDTGAHRRQGVGCPYCVNQRVLVGYNDFASKYPLLVKQWSPLNKLKPTEVSEKSNKTIEWICSRGHTWKSTPNTRAIGGGCGVCGRKTFVSGQNDLQTLFPEVAAEWHPTKNEITPDQIPPGRGSYWWLCSRGHEWFASGNGRTSGRGCPRCQFLDSKLEKIFGDYLPTIYTGEILQGKMPIRGTGKDTRLGSMQLDFWLPELGLAFEIQDFATHSRDSDVEEGKWRNGTLLKKGPTYHELKRRLAKEQLNVKLIDIWEDELIDGSFKMKIERYFNLNLDHLLT